MFERLMLHGAALAEKAARRRRGELAEALREEAPAGVEVSEEEDMVVLSGRGLGRRFALEPALRWLVLRQAQDEQGRRR
jgi:fructoselysine-6-P-deglycase FrlB-like protein